MAGSLDRRPVPGAGPHWARPGWGGGRWGEAQACRLVEQRLLQGRRRGHAEGRRAICPREQRGRGTHVHHPGRPGTQDHQRPDRPPGARCGVLLLHRLADRPQVRLGREADRRLRRHQRTEAALLRVPPEDRLAVQQGREQVELLLHPHRGPGAGQPLLEGPGPGGRLQPRSQEDPHDLEGALGVLEEGPGHPAQEGPGQVREALRDRHDLVQPVHRHVLQLRAVPAGLPRRGPLAGRQGGGGRGQEPRSHRQDAELLHQHLQGRLRAPGRPDLDGRRQQRELQQPDRGDDAQPVHLHPGRQVLHQQGLLLQQDREHPAAHVPRGRQGLSVSGLGEAHHHPEGRQGARRWPRSSSSTSWRPSGSPST